MMPPHAEETTMEIEEIPEAPKKNLAVAINWQVSLVDEFVSSTRKQRRSINTTVDAVPAATAEDAPTISEPDLKGKDSNVENNVDAANKKRSVLLSPDSIRRSGRDRQGKRDVSYQRAPVRYDMQLVPPVSRNKEFLRSFPQWWIPKKTEKQAGTRRSTRLVAPVGESTCCPERMDAVSPFSDESSVLWIPSKRSDWEDSVSEMVAVCTSAGLHRYLAQEEPQKRFHPPLSRDYIRDRVDIDDPLNGYQIRHKEGGWLQGFLLWTNFTTWTHFFRWDSLHEQSGVASTAESRLADRDGSLANELEACKRSGDPLVGGIVFPEIAEIALVGGLGCGEYLLRMALDGIRAERKYKFVVLQATDESKGFYERFGFKRVGAVCRYSSQVPTNENPLVGYRHWTHPNESDASLQLHGGPSYMMCLKLPSECTSCGRANCDVSINSFFETMVWKSAVDQKPLVEQLGGSTLPSFWKSASSSVASGSSNTSVKRRRGRPPSVKSSPARKKTIVQFSEEPILPPPITKRRFSNRLPTEPPSKRRKPSVDVVPRDVILTPALVSTSPTNESSTGQQGKPGVVLRNALKESPQQQKLKSKATGPNADTANIKKGEKKERLYHSVRGRDGRFTRIAIDGSEEMIPTVNTKSAPTKPPRPPSLKIDHPKSTEKLSTNRKPKRVNRAELKKQKVKAYPRDRIHFYNRVVKPQDGSKEYFFVLNYNENKDTIQIVPMQATGVCLGKHAGRPRYQCMIGDTDENFRTESTKDFQIVPATMVMKTSVVANEAWDIQDTS